MVVVVLALVATNAAFSAVRAVSRAALNVALLALIVASRVSTGALTRVPSCVSVCLAALTFYH